MQKCVNKMSMAEQKAMLENYNKVKAEQAKERGAKKEEPKNKVLNFRPKPVKTPFCAYCKTEGHWMRNRGEVICPKLLAKKERANYRRREIERKWRNGVSRDVSKETGMSGWEPVGPIGSISLWPRKIMTGNRSNGVRKEVVKASKNRFDLGEEDDASVSEEEEVVEVPSVVEGEGSLSGAWARPLNMGVGGEEVVDEKESTVSMAKYDPNVSWGDQC